MLKACVVCGASFQPYRPNQRFCSARCRLIAARPKDRARWASRSEKSKSQAAVWRSAHKEHTRVYRAAWQLAHTGGRSAYMAVWRSARREHRRVYQAAWQLAHPRVYLGYEISVRSSSPLYPIALQLRQLRQLVKEKA